MGVWKTHVSNIPSSTTAIDLVNLLEKSVGKHTVSSVDIQTNRDSFKPKGYGFVNFLNEAAADLAALLAENGHLVLLNNILKVRRANGPIVQKPQHDLVRLEQGLLSLSCQTCSDAGYDVLWSAPNVTTEIDFHSERLRYLLSIEDTLGKPEFKVEFLFKDITEIVAATTQEDSRALVLKASHPPYVYRRRATGVKTGDFLTDLFSGFSSMDPHTFRKEEQEEPWVRATDFTPNRSIGQSLAYALQLPTISSGVMNNLFKNLADFRLAAYPPAFRVISLQVRMSYVTSQVLVPIVECSEVNFELMFKVNQLVQLGIVSGPMLGPTFYQLLQSTPLEHAKLALQSMLDAKVRCQDPAKYVRDELARYKSTKLPISASIKLEEGLMWVHRLFVTPTKVYCMGPEIDSSNRVTRHHAAHINNFLRVSFVDEDWNRVPSTVLSTPAKGGALAGLLAERSEVFDRILSVLQKGVRLGGKKFDFLAFSSSQLREQSVWMFASNQLLTAQTIRKWMGDFLSIRNVAKCAARMGQCFSSSTPTLEVCAHEVQQLPDIKRADEYGLFQYCFSDGIGKISKAFAAEVARKCGLKKLQTMIVPSAFQIRYGGYKGVVAMDPRSQFKLSLRPSMRKFTSSHTGLEVLNSTRFLPCFLNRQIIVLLSTLGVSDSVFLQMQAQVVKHLDVMLKDAAVAVEVLQMTCSGDMHGRLTEMLLAGYHPKAEPYVMGLLRAFRASQLVDLRTRSRICVPKGRCLMGCLDETATLCYGEVFLQVTPTPGNRSFLDDGLQAFSKYKLGDSEQGLVAHVVTGLVVVAKNPCLHPGDIRVLKAVDVASLHHMVDCLVFPQKGCRPHPNECSGSDLDGDLYFVSWHAALIPPATDQPMDYCPPGEVKLDHAVTVEEIQEFFVKHMVNDSLGQIANAHVVHADREPELARSPKCNELAKLFAIAVDFPKTGVPAVIPHNLRPFQYPDYMEKEDKEMYLSQRVLGKLFRAVKEAASEQQPTPLISRHDIAYDPAMHVPGYEDYLEEASFYKNWYDRKLIGLMNQYGIQTEAEIVSGNIVHVSRQFGKRHGTVQDRIRLSISSLIKEARLWFEDKSHDYSEEGETHRSSDDAFAKASAWYYVTYHPDYLVSGEYSAASKNNIHLLSFPWVVYDVLLLIKGAAGLAAKV